MQSRLVCLVTCGPMSVTPAYEAKYHTYDEMAAYLTAWTDAFRTPPTPCVATRLPAGCSVQVCPRACRDLVIALMCPVPGPAWCMCCVAAAGLCELSSIGTSTEGRDLMLVTVTYSSTGTAASKPAFWLDGNTHAGEVTGCEACLHFLYTLLSDYASGDASTGLMLATSTIYCVPRVSPDGAELYAPCQKVAVRLPLVSQSFETRNEWALEQVPDHRALAARVHCALAQRRTAARLSNRGHDGQRRGAPHADQGRRG